MRGDPPRRPAKNRIKPEDQALWRKVVQDAVPLAPGLRNPLKDSAAVPSREPRKAVVPEVADPEPPRPPRVSRTLKPTGSAEPSVRIDWADGLPSGVGRPEPGLDRRNAERLRRGARDPDGRIDLHGMTAERAHRALDRYISGALARGHRLVLVITGKGAKRRDREDAAFMREDTGVLRQQAPRWLMTGPHAHRIVGIYQAHRRHGGAGAFYVYLKRAR